MTCPRRNLPSQMWLFIYLS